MGGIDHADLGARTGAREDIAVLPLYSGACMGIGSDDRSACPDMARLSGGV